MQLLQESIYPHLSAYPELTALVTDRITPHERPELHQLPALTYSEVPGGAHVESHQGSSGLASTLMQFSAWSRDYGEAARIREAVRLALQGYRGHMGAGDGLWVQAVQWVSGGETFEQDVKVFQTWCRLRFWHRVKQPGG